MNHILPSGNDEFANLGDQAMAEYLLSIDQGNESGHIKKIIINNLPSGNVTVEQVSKELGINARKLQRSLQEKSTTFSTLLTDTRMDIAKGYIQDKHMDLTEIAFLLGFAELSTFSRSFKRWTGKSPMQYRKAT